MQCRENGLEKYTLGVEIKNKPVCVWKDRVFLPGPRNALKNARAPHQQEPVRFCSPCVRCGAWGTSLARPTPQAPARTGRNENLL